MDRTNYAFRTKRKVVTRVLCVILAMALLPGLSVFASMPTLGAYSGGGDSSGSSDSGGRSSGSDREDRPDGGGDERDTDSRDSDERDTDSRDSDERDSDGQDAGDRDSDSQDAGDRDSDGQDAGDGDSDGQDAGDRDSDGQDAGDGDSDGQDADDGATQPGSSPAAGSDNLGDDFAPEGEEGNLTIDTFGNPPITELGEEEEGGEEEELEEGEEEEPEEEEEELEKEGTLIDGLDLFNSVLKFTFDLEKYQGKSGNTITFGLVLQQNQSNVDDWVIDSGDMQARITLPAGTEVTNFPGSTYLSYEYGDEDGPIPDYTPDKDEEQYLWITWDTSFYGTGTQTYTYVVKASENGFTPHDTELEFEAVLFYQGEESDYSGQSTYTVIADEFQWGPVIPDNTAKATISDPDANAATAQLGSTLGVQYKGLTSGSSATAGRMFTKEITLTDRYEIPFVEGTDNSNSSNLYLLIPEASFATYITADNNGVVTIPADGKTADGYVTAFDVTWTFTNTDEHAEISVSNPTVKLTNTTPVNLDAVRAAIAATSSNQVTFAVTSVNGNGEEVGKAYPFSDVDLGEIHNQENPLAITTTREGAVSITVSMVPEDLTLTPNQGVTKGISKIDNNVVTGNTNATIKVWADQQVTYTLGGFNNKQKGSLQNFTMEDTFDPKEITPLALSAGTYYVGSSNTVATGEVNVVFLDSAGGVLGSALMNYGDNALVSDLLGTGFDIGGIRYEYGEVEAGFRPATAPEVTFIVQDLTDRLVQEGVEEIEIVNVLDLSYDYRDVTYTKNDNAKLTSSKTIYFTTPDDNYQYRAEKEFKNITDSSRRDNPQPGDILEFTINYTNTVPRPFIRDLEVFDYYTDNLQYVNGSAKLSYTTPNNVTLSPALTMGAVDADYQYDWFHKSGWSTNELPPQRRGK